MIVDPLHDIFVLLALVLIYATLTALAWRIAFLANSKAMRLLNHALDLHRARNTAPLPDDTSNLEITLSVLVAEQLLSEKIAARLRRIAPVLQQGKWVAYPSNGYWAHRFERLKSR